MTQEGPTGGNPLQYNVHLGRDCEPIEEPKKRRYPKKRRKARPIKLYTAEQWAKLVQDIHEARAKGWSVRRVARNLNVSEYRCRQALLNPDYVPRSPEDQIGNPNGLTSAQARPSRPTLARRELPHPEDMGEREVAVADLLELIPSMRPASAAYWLRRIADDVHPA